MIQLNKIHHIAIICFDYPKSKHFYTEILGLEILQEIYREDRQSYKLNLALNGNYILELFSFPNPSKRVSNPEAAGLRHLAFEVNDIQETRNYIINQNCIAEEIRTDEFTAKKNFLLQIQTTRPLSFMRSNKILSTKQKSKSKI